MIKLVSDVVELRCNWCKTLVGDELDVEDLKASASGPPWFVPHAVVRSMLPSGGPVASFNEKSEEAFPGMEMERLVAVEELSVSSSGLGQSSKKCRSVCPPPDGPSFWASSGPVFSIMGSP